MSPDQNTPDDRCQIEGIFGLDITRSDKCRHISQVTYQPGHIAYTLCQPCAHKLEQHTSRHAATVTTKETVETTAPETPPHQPQGRSITAIPQLGSTNNPDTVRHYEALNATDLITDLIRRKLMNHPSIEANPSWWALARRAERELTELREAVNSANTAPEDETEQEVVED